MTQPGTEHAACSGGGTEDVSVVVCVHAEERWDDILEAVESLRRQNVPPVEIVVVVDHHPRLFRTLRGVLHDVVVVENTRERGLSGAKNTGVAVARGTVVAFLDDDAVAEPDWLAVLLRSYADPAVAGVAGTTLPLWATRRPAWFPEEFDWVVGCSYRGLARGRVAVRNFMGGNASFRREVFDIAGGFRPGMGRGPSGRPLGGEETEFCIRLTQLSPGALLVRDDRAVIWHRVPRQRATFAYFRARCFAEGLSKASVARHVGARDGLSSERAYASRTLPAGVLRHVAGVARGRHGGLVTAGAILAGLAWACAGYVRGVVAAPRARGSPRPRGTGPPAESVDHPAAQQPVRGGGNEVA